MGKVIARLTRLAHWMQELSKRRSGLARNEAITHSHKFQLKVLALGIVVPVALSGCMSSGTGDFQAPQRFAELYY
ncbi:MAG: hypothetical protein P8X51_10675 [Maritimibacter sp.]